MHRTGLVCLALLAAVSVSTAEAAERRSVVFILVDDQRFDALSFLGHPFLETPRLDALAAEGAVFRNAFVTTSLCSPSRASILTGQYAHKHRVLANRTPLPLEHPTFPVVMREQGYRTAFVGKWHMGGANDAPRPGFDHWVSFPGQGAYFDQAFNVDGEHMEQTGYITDRITDYAVDFIGQQTESPFLLYVSHKAVHADFKPAARHRGSYADRSYPYPTSMADSDENYAGKPDWVRAQRNSWHGVDGMYDRRVDFDGFVIDYAETLRAVDESVGRIVDALSARGLLEDTLMVFTSDNGFQFGEHGLIDKRTMYEASIRVPLIVHCPALVSQGRVQDQLILNIDFAPTFMELAGAEIPEPVQGRSFLAAIDRPGAAGRDAFLYQYFWERAFPQTPTVLGIRTQRYKLMRYHGVWDRYELYDLQVDPDERRNLLAEYVTTTEAGHIESRVARGPERVLEGRFADGALDANLKALFQRLHTRLDELLDETECAREPGWHLAGS